MATDTERVDDLPPRFHGVTGAIYRGALAGTLTALAYLVVLTAYLATTTAEVIDVGRAGYPLVWFVTGAAALAAVTTADGPPAGAGSRTPAWAVTVAGGYVLLLAGVSGLLTLDVAGVGVSTSGALPGWGPVVLADLGVVGLAIVPFQSVGYVVLGVLLARALAVGSGSLAAGVVGLFSCAGCVLPIVAAVASAGGVPLFEGVGSYRLSTVAFVSAALLLAGVIVRGAGTCRR